MSEDFAEDRRRLLAALGTATATAAAGCSGLDPEKPSTDKPGTETGTDHTETTETPSYEINLQDTLKYDLTDLPTADLDQHTEETVDTEYSKTLSGTITRGNREAKIQKLLTEGTENWEDIKNITLEAQHQETYRHEDENGRDIESYTDIPAKPAYQFPDRTNIKAEISFKNGDTVTKQGTKKEVVKTLSEKSAEWKEKGVTSYTLKETNPVQIQTTQNTAAVPEYEVIDGDTLHLNIELENGETHTASAQVNKELPESYRIDVRTPEDFNTGLENYTTPYQFDTHHFDHDLFHTIRENTVILQANDNLNGENTTLEDKINWTILENFYKEDVQNEGLSEKQKKQNMIYAARGHMINQGIVRETSEPAHLHAIYEEAILRKAVDKNIIEENWEEIYFSGFDNFGGHGSVGAYIGGKMHEDVLQKSEKPGEDDTWYAVETILGEVEPPGNFKNIDMVDGTNEEFVSTLAEIWASEQKQRNTEINDPLDFENKMIYANTAITRFASVSGFLGGSLQGNKHLLKNALKSIRNNENWENFMIPVEIASDARISRETGDTIIADSENGAALIETTRDNADKIPKNKDLQTPNAIEQELLKTAD